MKLTISTVALVALAAVSAAGAGASQDRIPAVQRPTADAQKPATMDAPGITITGCVARGTTADTFTLAEVKKDAPAADATTPAALVLLTGTVLLVGALTYIPALALGPVAEHLLLWTGR